MAILAMTVTGGTPMNRGRPPGPPPTLLVIPPNSLPTPISPLRSELPQNPCILFQEVPSIVGDRGAFGAFPCKCRVFHQTFCRRPHCFQAHPRILLHFLNFPGMLPRVFIHTPGDCLISDTATHASPFFHERNRTDSHSPPRAVLSYLAWSIVA